MKKIKLLPPIVTLTAGAITSISTYLLGYDIKTMLLILLIVLVIFYVLGVIAMRLVLAFPNKKTEAVSDEGEVIDKGTDEIKETKENDVVKKDNENKTDNEKRIDDERNTDKEKQ